MCTYIFLPKQLLILGEVGHLGILFASLYVCVMYIHKRVRLYELVCHQNSNLNFFSILILSDLIIIKIQFIKISRVVLFVAEDNLS